MVFVVRWYLAHLKCLRRVRDPDVSGVSPIRDDFRSKGIWAIANRRWCAARY
ncbi:hypothetical protein KCP69_25525 [Salmonella enterica subsp. enterica]|nr:hypothetical protein KCP69_25525 [Salmonella enterica subsp. enterica]